MTLLPINTDDAAVQVIIDELKIALGKDQDHSRALTLANAIKSLEAGRGGVARFHAKALEAAVDADWEQHAHAIDERSQRIVATVLTPGSSARVLLCGAPVQAGLAALRGVLAKAQIGGYVYPGSRFDIWAYEPLLKQAASEGKVVVLTNGGFAAKPLLYGYLESLSLAREEKVPVVVVVETELGKLPGELVASCLVVDLAQKLGREVKSKERIRELCAGRVPVRTLELLSRMTGKRTLETLEGMAVRVAETDPFQLAALIELMAKTEDARRSKGRAQEVEWVEPGHYHVDLINTDRPPALILAGMRAGAGKKGSRVLMIGPPGSGKTECGKWLAKELGVPLYQRRASDLLHWRLGMFEKLIHQAFVDAARDGAVLLIDEVESLILAREMNRNWAAGLSLTNTFLTELDLFQGLFIACTNHAELLDSALMRRIPEKVEFGPLRERDRATAYERELARFGGPLGEQECRRLERLEGLCLGDIGNIARRLDLVVGSSDAGTAAAADIVAMLEKEVKLRNLGSGNRIGFA